MTVASGFFFDVSAAASSPPSAGRRLPCELSRCPRPSRLAVDVCGSAGVHALLPPSVPPESGGGSAKASCCPGFASAGVVSANACAAGGTHTTSREPPTTP